MYLYKLLKEIFRNTNKYTHTHSGNELYRQTFRDYSGKSAEFWYREPIDTDDSLLSNCTVSFFKLTDIFYVYSACFYFQIHWLSYMFAGRSIIWQTITVHSIVIVVVDNLNICFKEIVDPTYLCNKEVRLPQCSTVVLGLFHYSL